VGQGSAERLNTSLPDFINGIRLEEYSKLECGRILWRVPAYRERLLNHWHDPPHPHAERFIEQEAEVRQRGLNLRVVVKETPSVFGSFL
jgi:hypothetical protein